MVKVASLREATHQEIDSALACWVMLGAPPGSIESAQSPENTRKLELATSNWLYDLVKQNVKRGRIFLLRDVLLHRQADCLGYAKLMACLGKRFALDIGIVEVVIDNGGRYTPHYVNLIKFSSGKWQFIDLWYGSRDVRHRRIGLEVKQGGRWQVKDLDWDELKKVEDFRGLPSNAIDGIDYYILGNRHLERGIHNKSEKELCDATAHYSKAIDLYPGYARAYFNRAAAYENKGEEDKARMDYAQAVRDESSQIRVLAREHEDVIRLMELDRANIGMKEQEMYLLRKGFITGKEAASADIAQHFGVSEGEVAKVLSRIEAKRV